MVTLRPCSPDRACSRRGISRALLCLCLAANIVVPCAQAQSAEPVQLSPHDRPSQQSSTAATADGRQGVSLHVRPLQVDVDLVLVPVTITDAMNHAVTGLRKEDFVLFEHDEQQQIRYFSSEDEPISLGVILDLSKSMTNKIDVAREAVAAFFQGANPQDDYFVVTFADRPQLLAEPTRSVGYVQSMLATVKPAGHTALLDAIYLGIQQSRSARYKRRALLIISDGGDNHSRYRSREVKKLVQEADVEICAIGIFDSIFKTPEEWAGKRLLTEITEATGGRTITLSNSNLVRLPEIAANISWELRSRYVLGYQPKNPVRDGRWRKIKVQLAPSANTAQLQIYWKRGYLARAQ